MGKNKLSESNTGDYVQGIQELAPYADYVVINISSPNTPNLRKLQDKSPLEELLSTAVSQISRVKQENVSIFKQKGLSSLTNSPTVGSSPSSIH